MCLSGNAGYRAGIRGYRGVASEAPSVSHNTVARRVKWSSGDEDVWGDVCV